MTATYSRARQQAEVAFGNVQTEFFSKNKAMEEFDSATQQREAKTLRLREARLAKEQAERASQISSLFAKRTKKD